MRPVPEDLELQCDALGETLRAVRKHRRMRQTEVADALGISRRTYIDLEAGGGRFPLELFIAFADVTDSDRLALLVAIVFKNPNFAVYCADNKLMWLMAIAADEFADAVGAQMGTLRPQEIMSAFQAVYSVFAAELAERNATDGRLLRRREPTDDDAAD